MNIKFHENSFGRSGVVPCGRKDGQTEMTNLRFSFRNFATAPKKNKCDCVRIFFTVIIINAHFSLLLYKAAGLSNADAFTLQ
jgi:hypothetical protein